MLKRLQLFCGVFIVLGITACGMNAGNIPGKDLALTNNPDFDWQAITDSANGGNSTGKLELVPGHADQPGAVRLDYTLKDKYQYRFSTAAILFSNIQNWSKLNGVTFWLKGSGHKLRLILCQTTVKDYDFHGFVIDKTPTEWTEISIPFSAFKQEGWGKALPFDPSQILELDLKAASSQKDEQGFFMVDEMRVIKGK